MAKQAGNLIDVLGANPAEKDFLRQVADADPQGFGYLVKSVFPVAQRHKAETGETINLYELADADPAKWHFYVRGAKAGQRRETELKSASDSPLYSFFQTMAQKYGPKGELPLQPVADVARSLLRAFTLATPGLQNGRGRKSKFASLVGARPTTFGSVDRESVSPIEDLI